MNSMIIFNFYFLITLGLLIPTSESPATSFPYNNDRINCTNSDDTHCSNIGRSIAHAVCEAGKNSYGHFFAEGVGDDESEARDKACARAIKSCNAVYPDGENSCMVREVFFSPYWRCTGSAIFDFNFGAFEAFGKTRENAVEKIMNVCHGHDFTTHDCKVNSCFLVE